MAPVMQRLSIDLPADSKRKIKLHATLKGMTIREYVLNAVEESLRKDDDLGFPDSTRRIGPVLKEIWDNEKDAVYDDM